MRRLIVFLLITAIFVHFTNPFAESIENTRFQVWSLGAFKDDFGDPTNESFIQIKAKGKFSNSATSDSDCTINMIVTKEHVGLFLYEYNRRPAVSFIGNNGVVNMKNSAGKTDYSVVIDKWGFNGGLTVTGYPIIKMLKISNGFVRFVVNDHYSSVYLFKINANGFMAAFNKL